MKLIGLSVRAYNVLSDAGIVNSRGHVKRSSLLKVIKIGRRSIRGFGGKTEQEIRVFAGLKPIQDLRPKCPTCGRPIKPIRVIES